MTKLSERLKLLKDIPVANEKLYKQVADKLHVSPKQVQECVALVGEFIADTIKKGAFETVMVPKFGKFKAKTKKVQWMNHRRVMPTLPTHIKPKKDETI